MAKKKKINKRFGYFLTKSFQRIYFAYNFHRPSEANHCILKKPWVSFTSSIQRPPLLETPGMWFQTSLSWALAETSEKAMAPHSSTLAWKIPWTEGPDWLQSMGSLGVGHDWATSLYFFTFMHWRRKWQPTPVFLPGESQGRGSLVGCHLWGRTESDTTEATWRQQQQRPTAPVFLNWGIFIFYMQSWDFYTN